MKKLLISLFISAVAFNLFAYDVDREELEMNKQEVEFINYTGTHDKIDTRKEIYSIGTSLGYDIQGKQNVSLSGKYRVLHLVDPTEPEKLGADIFILEKHANVDHIRNLRLILSGYLKTAYGYSDSDSSLLAEFITYYNAVFRGKTEYFETKYNNMVLVNISSENAGLDIHYKNWPGKTRIVIPLRNGKNGDAPSLSPGELSDKEVIEDLRKNEDMGVGPRKEMVELREKELEKDLDKAAEKEEQIVKEKEKASEEKEKVEEDIKELEEKKTAGTVTEKEYEEEKKILSDKKEEIVKKEDDLDKEIEKVKAETEAIEEEKAEISEERDVIAADTNKLLDNKTEAEETSSVTGEIRKSDETFFIKVLTDSDGKYGEIVLLDSSTGEVGEKASVKKSGIRGFLELPGSSLLITGSDDGNKFNLMKIDKNTLSVKARSEANIYRDTVICEKSGFIYAVVDDNGSYKIGKFSADLVLESSSDETALADTFIFHDPENRKIFFQNSGGEIKALNTETLSPVE